MKNSDDKLLLAHCVNYLIENGGLAFIKLIISVKESSETGRYGLDPSVLTGTISLDVDTVDDDTPLVDLIEGDAGDPMDHAIEHSRAALLNSLVNDLRPRERQIVRMRFGLSGYHPHILFDVGREIGLTTERIRQLEATSLRTLRTQLVHQGLTLETI